eukprot:10574107-Alexandrium_andersonii.AAC.1
MCIRDRGRSCDQKQGLGGSATFATPPHPFPCAPDSCRSAQPCRSRGAVSYTHLTLPTICSV